MKKVLCLSLVFLVLINTAIANTSDVAIHEIQNFEAQFNAAAKLIGSGHKITENNLKFTSGPVNDVFTIILDDNIGMNITVPHQKSTITEVALMYAPDGDIASATSFIAAIGELALTFGAVEKTQDVGAFIENLGLFDTDFSDGSKGYIVLKDIRYSWQSLQSLGIWFYVKAADRV